MNYRKKGRRLKKPDKAIFEMYYNNQNITVDELAELWNVKKSTIYKWASEFRKEKT